MQRITLVKAYRGLSTLMKSFASDNYSGVHPKIFSGLQEANIAHEKSYGSDVISQKATELFHQHFGKDSLVFFVMTGTAANILSIQACCKSFEAVICAADAHINVDECGGPEKIAGVKLLTVPVNSKGKITVEQISQFLPEGLENNVHSVQPRLISISQCTENGTIYSLDELREICSFAKSKGLFVHMDGARISNAAASLKVGFHEMTVDVGIDIVSFGGTKNGLMFGEAVVVLNPSLAQNIAFYRKQNGFLYSKMRFIAAQFVQLLQDDLWLEIASHSNQMAKYLYSKLSELEEIKIVYPVEANEIFAVFPIAIIGSMQEKFPFYTWNERENIVRLVTSFDTNTIEIDEFIIALEEQLKINKERKIY